MRNLGRGLGIIGLGICLGVVAGCATGHQETDSGATSQNKIPWLSTGYQKAGWRGGYSDMKIQDDIFKVNFKGNPRTSEGQAGDFALLRCAEVTLENGYKYFIVIDEKASSETGSHTTPVQVNRDVMGNTHVTGGGTNFYSKPSNQITIKCFKEKPENSPVLVYDAEQVKTNIKNQYGIE